jgi:hypothetical protein
LKDESALIQYIKTPLAETNQLYFFLIDPSEYPRVSTKDAEETKVP